MLLAIIMIMLAAVTTVSGSTELLRAETQIVTTYERVQQLSEIDPAEDYVLAIDRVIPIGATGSDPEMMVAISTGRPSNWPMNFVYEPFSAEQDASNIGLLWNFELDGSGFRIKTADGGANDYLIETAGPAATLGTPQTFYLSPGSDPENGEGFRIRTGASSGNYLGFTNLYDPGGGYVSAFSFGNYTANTVFRFYKVVEREIEIVIEPDFSGNEWNTNAVYAINREDPHANFIAYDNEADAKEYHTLHKEESDYYYSLNGTWKFHWAHNPENRASDTATPGFTGIEYDDSEWDDTEVPKMWQANFKENGDFKYDGYIFMTSGVPWGGSFRNPVTGTSVTNGSVSQPTAPANWNPVATYRKTFTVPEQWKDENRSVYVHFDGVGSNCYVWINGNRIGYAEDTFSQKDFDLTPYINYNGENVITVQVFRWSSGTWWELQDMNRLSGIFRNVYLVSRAKVNLYDVQTLTTPVTEDVYDGNWNLNVKALLRDLGATDAERNNARLEAKLYDASDALVGQTATAGAPAFTARENTLGNTFRGADSELNMEIATPNLWSSEKPYLYKLVLSLYNGNRATEITCIRIGFRQVKIVNAGNAANVRFLINGSRILLNGANQHESNPETGYTQTLDLIRTDIEIMKNHNINALRMSHYPHDTRYYDLCDEYGIYIMDEANLECHGATSVVNSLNTVNAWGEGIQDRINTMMHRTWNYPSVISWSMGNENNSIATTAQARYNELTTVFAKQKDPSRPVHAQYLNSPNVDLALQPDFYSGMYATASGWRNTVNTTTRATLQCEYLHTMGNSGGNMDEYMETFELPSTSGGFTWDFVDQTLWTPIRVNNTWDGESWYLGFGGDWAGEWGSGNHSANINSDGMISGDRRLYPSIKQVKYGYRMLKVTDFDQAAGTYTVSNKFVFTNANEYDMAWELLENGAVIQSGTTALDVPPAPSGIANTSMTSRTFAVPFTRPETIKPGAEYLFNVNFKEKNDTLWADAGYVLSENQYEVDFSVERDPFSAVPNGALEVTETGDSVTITGEDTDFSVTINKEDGTIGAYKFKGRDLLNVGPAPSFWRAPNDNEKAWYTGGTNSETTFMNNYNWRNTGRTRTTDSANIQVQEESSYTKVTVAGTFPNKTDAAYETVYTVYPNGEVNVGYNYSFGAQTGNHQYAPEIGSIMTVSPGFDNMTWYGRRGETHVDRKTGSPVGFNEMTVEDNFTAYSRTQETGFKVDTRWFALTDDDGFGMLVKGGGTIPTPPNTDTMADTSLIQFSALHYTPEDLTPAPGNTAAGLLYHPYQLTKRDEITLRVVITSTGVGGDNMWGATPLTPYRVNVNNKTYIYNYSILPVEELNIENAFDFAALAPYEDAQMLDFELAGEKGVIDSAAGTVDVVLPGGTSLAGLTPVISVNEGSTITPTGPQDFSAPVTYCVTSVGGGVTKEYTVRVSYGYDVTFDLRGGSIDDTPGNVVTLVASGRNAVLPGVPTLRLDGVTYSFEGWSDSPGGEPIDPTQEAITEDTVFYALWGNPVIELYTIADSGIKTWQYEKNTNYGRDGNMLIRNQNAYGVFSQNFDNTSTADDTDIKTALVMFDVAGVDPSAVGTAILHLTHLTGGSGRHRINAAKIPSTWNETSVTWNNHPRTAIDLTTQVQSEQYTAGGTQRAIELDVTDIVNGLASDENRLSFVLSSSVNNNEIQLMSRNHASAATNPKLAPWIEIPLEALAIDEQPVDQAVSQGDDATFTIAATGTPQPTYQWQVSTNGAQWNDIAGAVGASLTVEDATQDQSGNQYRCVVTNLTGELTSEAAVLQVADTIVSFESAANIVSTVTVMTTAPNETDLILAAYDAAGRMIRSRTYQPSAAGAESISVNFDCTGAATVRAFLWSKAFVPLSQPKDVFVR